MEEIKQRMSDYWTQRVESFSALRRKELAGEKHEQWLAELMRYLPAGKRCRILDIGTGTGFFALLLAAKGHEVTGIDLTEGMIREAERMAEELSLPVSFLVMDAEKPDFLEGSFDVLVTRNLTWTLPHLEQAYQSWYELLSPGGILINFDADYCREKRTELPKMHAHHDIGAELVQEYESMKSVLRPLQRERPEWDRELLLQAGFCEVSVDFSVWERIYARKDEFYNPTPIFALVAKKKEPKDR